MWMQDDQLFFYDDIHGINLVLHWSKYCISQLQHFLHNAVPYTTSQKEGLFPRFHPALFPTPKFPLQFSIAQTELVNLYSCIFFLLCSHKIYIFPASLLYQSIGIRVNDPHGTHQNCASCLFKKHIPQHKQIYKTVSEKKCELKFASSIRSPLGERISTSVSFPHLETTAQFDPQNAHSCNTRDPPK